MTMGDGIAIAGCAWSAAYLTRWVIHTCRQARSAKLIADGFVKLLEAFKAL